MFVAAALAIVVGAILGAGTAASDRIRIADEAYVAILVGVSGAVAGWAFLGTLVGVGQDGPDVYDAIGAAAGALVMITLAWRGRRRTFGDLGLRANSQEHAAAHEPQRVTV